MQSAYNPKFGEAVRCNAMKIKHEAKKNKTSYLLYLEIYSLFLLNSLKIFYMQAA
ncbi:hypothetical protein EV201_2742 [Ancylomarina subtilis]|uniref:Uncharacterized protein n=1 Tax=Ancylomarina subtilis TaxID=1639035 RepID=A0A4V2FSD1_9BACT|nr:hypothetical protein EV201_2742 [Ancylomarina subtilis]